MATLFGSAAAALIWDVCGPFTHMKMNGLPLDLVPNYHTQTIAPANF
jgi:hypothetical protein